MLPLRILVILMRFCNWVSATGIRHFVNRDCIRWHLTFCNCYMTFQPQFTPWKCCARGQMSSLSPWLQHCEKIQADFTVSWVLQKHFNFVPMLESRNLDHMKSNCSDITVSSVFHNYFNFVPMLESRNMDPLKNFF